MYTNTLFRRGDDFNKERISIFDNKDSVVRKKTFSYSRAFDER